MGSSIVVDATDGVSASQGRQLLQSLKSSGLAILAGALPVGLDTQALGACERLFDLSVEQKLRHRAVDGRSSGFCEFGRATALDTGLPNLLESWRIPPNATMLPLHTSDVQALSALRRTLRKLTDDILAVVEHVYDAPGQCGALLGDEAYELYALHYPRRLLGSLRGAVRQSVHFDSSLVTLLPRSSSPGLFAWVDGVRTPILSEPRGVVVMAGAALEYITGGGIPACRHTVETPLGAEMGSDRLALTFFSSPLETETLHLLPGAELRQRGAGWPPILVSDFYKQRYERAYRPSGLHPDKN